MSRRQLFIILGVWIIVFLFLGIPSTWDKIFAILTGLIIVVSAVRMKTSKKIVSNSMMPYVEHKSEPAKVDITGMNPPVNS